ncbi:MAG: thioredoxin [Alphaproteobacteria bacterium]
MDLIFKGGRMAGGKPAGTTGSEKTAPGGGGGPDELIKDCGSATFVADVIDASHHVPVIVDLWAPWCGPCKQIGPVLEKLVRQAGGAVRLVKINVDENQKLAAQLRVQSIPAVFAFRGGQLVDGFVGALPESQIKSFLQRVLGDAGSGVDEALAEARTLLDSGEVESAEEIYQQILSQDPANTGALAGILRCMMARGQNDRALALLAKLPAETAAHADIVSVRTALDLAAQAPQGDSLQGLKQAVAADPDNHRARFDLAMAHFAAGASQMAVEALLEIVRRDRTWEDDGARKQLLKLFEAMGHADPVTVAGRRKLSSLLFS